MSQPPELLETDVEADRRLMTEGLTCRRDVREAVADVAGATLDVIFGSMSRPSVEASLFATSRIVVGAPVPMSTARPSRLRVPAQLDRGGRN